MGPDVSRGADAERVRLLCRATALRDDLDALVSEKHANERTWSWVASAVTVPVVAASGLGAVIGTLTVDSRLVPAALTAFSTAVAVTTTALPYDRKRRGNKILGAKAVDLRERVDDLRDDLEAGDLAPAEGLERLRRLRFEKNVLQATSSSHAALEPFRAMVTD